MAIYDRERYKVALPQLEKRLEHIENGVDVKVVELRSNTISSIASDGYGVASADLEEIKGYTAYAISACPIASGNGTSRCIVYSLRISGGKVTCYARNTWSSTATDVAIRFRVIYIANKMLTAGTATASSSGGGSGGGGTNDYTALINKPSIELVELTGNKSFGDLGLNPLDNMDLAEILI